MLVCVFFCTSCTRDRGCSVHPVFPAPSVFRGARFHHHLGRDPRRGSAESHLLFEKSNLEDLVGWVERLRNPSLSSVELMGFASLYPSYTPAPILSPGSRFPARHCR